MSKYLIEGSIEVENVKHFYTGKYSNLDRYSAFVVKVGKGITNISKGELIVSKWDPIELNGKYYFLEALLVK